MMGMKTKMMMVVVMTTVEVRVAAMFLNSDEDDEGMITEL